MGLEKASSNTPTRVGDEVMKNNIPFHSHLDSAEDCQGNQNDNNHSHLKKAQKVA